MSDAIIKWRVERWTPTGMDKPTEVRVVASDLDGHRDFATIRFLDADGLAHFIDTLGKSMAKVFGPACETCGGDRVVIVDDFANGRERSIEVPCPDCTEDDVDELDDRAEPNPSADVDDRLKDPPL